MFPWKPPLNSWFSCSFLWFFPVQLPFQGDFVFICFSWSIKKTSTLLAGWDTHMEFSAKLMNPLGAVLGEYLSETHVRIIVAWQNAEWLCVLEEAWKKATKTTPETMACMVRFVLNIIFQVRFVFWGKVNSWVFNSLESGPSLQSQAGRMISDFLVAIRLASICSFPYADIYIWK